MAEARIAEARVNVLELSVIPSVERLETNPSTLHASAWETAERVLQPAPPEN